MLHVKEEYEDIILLSDDDFEPHRYWIIENFLESRSLEVIDYEIIISDDHDIFGCDASLTPKDDAGDFIAGLKGLVTFKKNSEDDSSLKFKVKALAQKKRNKEVNKPSNRMQSIGFGSY